MRSLPVYLSDLFLLRDIFTPQLKEIALFDPYHRITGIHGREVRFLKEPLTENQGNTFFIDLTAGINEKELVPNALFAGTQKKSDSTALYFINNPDGTIRWIFPSEGKIPGYLSLYNSNTLKGKVYKTITQLAWKIGKQQHLVSGVIYLQQNLFDTVKQNYEISNEESISFFTGTRGETRKVVMEITKGNQSCSFIKIPVTEKSKSLIQNETDMLSSLSNYDFTTLSIPKISKKIKGYSRISNVKPAVTISADRITAIHVSALAELYNLCHEQKMVKDTAAWTAIGNNMEFMKQEMTLMNGLNEGKAKRIILLLRKLYNSIQTDDIVSVSVSHGDFTPWNMYCDEQRLYVYDWELAKNGIPMLFDLYHFSFQSVILQQRKDFTAIKKSISYWQATPLVQKLVQKYQINPSLNFRLYLLFNVSHYLRQYIGEKELLMQSQWMMDAWSAALDEIVNTADNPA